MATQTAPEIKLANVGAQRKKEKKRSGLPLWWAGPSGAAFKGAMAKIVVALLVGTMGVGAHIAGRRDRPDPRDYTAKKGHQKLFNAHDEAAKQDYGNVTGLPGVQNPSADSLSMVAQSMDGKTDAQRQAEAAATAAAASASAPAPTDGKAAAPAAPNIDPAALMAAAGKDGKDADAAKEGKDGKFGKKIGELSKNFGGSSSGLLAGGGGLSGGSGGSFKPLAGGGGSMRSFSSGSGVPRGAGQRSRGSARSAIGQLVKAAQLSNLARTQTGEQSATTAGAAFNGNPGGGSAILGNGAGMGGGAAAGTSGTAGSQGGGGGGGPTSSPGIGGETGTSGQTSDCGIMGADVGQSLVSNGYGGCVPDVNHTDVTPWSKWSQAAQIALAAGALLLALAQLVMMIEKSYPQAKWLRKVVYVLAFLALLCGLTALVAGFKIFSMGGQIEGVMDMLGGTIMTVMAIKTMKDQSDQSDDIDKKEEANKAKAQEMADKQLQGHKDLQSRFNDPKNLDPNGSGSATGEHGYYNGDRTGVSDIREGAHYDTIKNADGSEITRYDTSAAQDGSSYRYVSSDANHNITGWTNQTSGTAGTTYSDYIPTGNGGSVMTNQQVLNGQGQLIQTTSVGPNGQVTQVNNSYVTGGDGNTIRRTQVTTTAGADGYQDVVNGAPNGSRVSVVRDANGNPVIQQVSPNASGGTTTTYFDEGGSKLSGAPTGGTFSNPPMIDGAGNQLGSSGYSVYNATGSSVAGTSNYTVTSSSGWSGTASPVQGSSGWYQTPGGPDGGGAKFWYSSDGGHTFTYKGTSGPPPQMPPSF